MKRMKSEHLTEVFVHCYVLDSEEHTKEKKKNHFFQTRVRSHPVGLDV